MRLKAKLNQKSNIFFKKFWQVSEWKNIKEVSLFTLAYPSQLSLNGLSPRHAQTQTFIIRYVIQFYCQRTYSFCLPVKHVMFHHTKWNYNAVAITWIRLTLIVLGVHKSGFFNESLLIFTPIILHLHIQHLCITVFNYTS